MKKLLAAMLVLVMLFTVALPRQQANAEAMTLAIIGGAALAVGVGAGLVYTTSNMTASQMQGYITGRLQNYISRQGTSFGDWLAGEYVRMQAGKLIIPALLYNKIKNFLNSEIEENEITTTSKQIAVGSFLGFDVLSYASYGTIRGINEGYQFKSAPTASGLSVCLEDGYMKVYMDGSLIGSPSASKRYKTGWCVYWNSGGYLNVGCKQSTSKTDQDQLSGTIERVSVNIDSYKSQVVGYTVSAVLDDYSDGAIDPGYQWEGSVYEGPDTNLDDLIQDIYDGVIGNDLIIDDDVVVENPPVDPQPTTPPTTDIPGALDGIQEGINDLIGTQTGILDGIDDITGSLEGVQEGVGAISEALEGVGSDVGSIAEALDVPAANTLRLPDLRTLFPFCIPFDLYNIISAFAVEPQAPRVQIPFNIPRIGLEYTFDFDFSSFDTVAQVCRTMEFIAFAIGLAILTSKVIRW